MIQKVLLILSSALISAGLIGTNDAPTSTVSYSSTPVIEKTFNTPTGYTKIIQSQPVYRSILTTKDFNYESPDGTQHTVYTKSLDTTYSSLKKYKSNSTKDGDVIVNTIPGIYSTAVNSLFVYHQGAVNTVSSPLIYTPALTKSVSGPVSVPVSYTTHSVPLTKTIVSPTSVSHSTPVFDQTEYVTSGLSSYSSHTSVSNSQPIKTTINYSQPPLVSHMSFSGLGASYAW